MSPGRLSRPGEAEDLALERFAEEILAPLKRRSVEIDVTAGVMRRIALAQPRPAPAPLPAPWAGYAWAATLFLGLAAIGILMATAIVMMASGDEGARTALTLASTAARQTVRGVAVLGGFLLALGEAALAIGRGGWTLIEVAAPLVRGAGTLAALCGALSIGISIVVVSRAGRHAPLAARASWNPLNGGLS